MAQRPHPSRLRPTPRTPSQAGFSLLEVLIGGILLGLALLTHAASTLSEHRLAKQQQTRSEVLHAVRQFMGRLRADDDWAGLYGRLQAVTQTPKGTSDVTLEDGTVVRPLTTYYPDHTLADGLVSLRVHVAVPTVQAQLGAGMPVLNLLREDANMPQFGLPADLDGDGEIQTIPLNSSYNALPVAVTFYWVAPGETSQIYKVFTWLRGER